MCCIAESSAVGIRHAYEIGAGVAQDAVLDDEEAVAATVRLWLWQWRYL